MVNLSTFDWTAIAAIGQVSAAAATIFSLWLLWHQIRLTKDQVRESQESLRLAMLQVEESRRQADQARHDAVYPYLLMDGFSAYSFEDRPAGIYALRRADKVVYLFGGFRNHGIGAAYNLAMTMSSGLNVTEHSIGSIVEPEEKGRVYLAVERPVSGKVLFQWQDLFGKQFHAELVLSDSEECITANGRDADSTEYRRLAQSRYDP